MENLELVSFDSLCDWKCVGEGSFGEVHKARHTEWNIDVAVKILKTSMPHDLQELISEAKKMHAASVSQHVTRLYGILESSSSYGIVMEYMERGCLASLIKHFSPVPWALKFRILHEVALGMNRLHSLSTPLLHLDLKTTNVLLNTDLHIKVSDFGLSKFNHNYPNCDMDSECAGGTLKYMPPEAFQEGYVPDKSTDVYSFAILSSVVLTGNEPYPDAKSCLIPIRIPRGDRPHLCSEEEKLSVICLKAATELTEQCWHDDKHQRPQFSECCNQWELFFGAHKNNIFNAVRQVQDKMMSSTATVSETSSTLSITSSDMIDALKRLEDLNITHEPSVQQNAVPTRNKPVNKTLQTRTSTANQTGPMTSGQGFYSFQPSGFVPNFSHQQPIPVQNWAGTQPQSSFTTSSFPSININGNTRGIQIGNYNVMNITCNTRTHEQKATSKRLAEKKQGPTYQHCQTRSKGQVPGQLFKTQTPVQWAAGTGHTVQQSPMIAGALQLSQTSHSEAITSNLPNITKKDQKPLQVLAAGSGNPSSQQNQDHSAEEIQAKPQTQI